MIEGVFLFREIGGDSNVHRTEFVPKMLLCVDKDLYGSTIKKLKQTKQRGCWRA